LWETSEFAPEENPAPQQSGAATIRFAFIFWHSQAALTAEDCRCYKAWMPSFSDDASQITGTSSRKGSFLERRK
jgi:hypothetical protein